MRLTLLVCVLSALLGVLPSPASATHGYDLDCSDFSNQAAAQAHLAAHPGDPDGLDGGVSDGRSSELVLTNVFPETLPFESYARIDDGP